MSIVSEGGDANRESTTEPHDPYSSLRSPDFRRYLVGCVVGLLGLEMQNTAIGWELYERTKSAFDLGLVGLAQVIPVIALAIPAGHLSDRYPRRNVWLGSQFLSVAASTGLALISWTNGPIWAIYVCLFATGISSAIRRPAIWAIVPQLVPKGVVGNAFTWQTTVLQISGMVGPALGGLLIAKFVSASPIYFLSIISSIIVIMSVMGMKSYASANGVAPLSLESLTAGFHFVTGTRLILATITLDLFAVLFGGAVALLPIFAKDLLQVGPTGLGWLRAAPAAGAFAMALFMAHRPPMTRAGVALLWAVSGFGVATICFGLSRDPYLSFAMLFLTGAFDNVSVVVRATLVQVLTPDSMRGRVSAVNGIFIATSNELGSFESGLTAHWFGPTASVVGGGLGSLLVVLATMDLWPEVARLGRLEEVKSDDA